MLSYGCKSALCRNPHLVGSVDRPVLKLSEVHLLSRKLVRATLHFARRQQEGEGALLSSCDRLSDKRAHRAFGRENIEGAALLDLSAEASMQRRRSRQPGIDRRRWASMNSRSRFSQPGTVTSAWRQQSVTTNSVFAMAIARFTATEL